MKPESRTACWIIVTLGFHSSAGFSGDLRGSLPDPHMSGLSRSYIVKIAKSFAKTMDITDCLTFQ